MRKAVKRELCQPDNILIYDNLVEMSNAHGIVVNFHMTSGHDRRGIVKQVDTQERTIYLRLQLDGQETQRHDVLNMDRIVFWSFDTSPGLLDNLVA